MTYACGNNLAHEDFLDVGGLQTGAGDGRLDGVHAELWGGDGGEGPLKFSYGGSCCGEDDDFLTPGETEFVGVGGTFGIDAEVV